MTDWWTVPYKLGNKPNVKMPRNLYPPDVKGYPPSTPGPDALAIKRIVCKLGRFGKWDVNQWDNAFNNRIAHGYGGNVSESGIEGVQRQQKIQPTGNIGQATFDVLISALIPEGRDNAGKRACQQYEIDLFNDAYEMFHQPATTPDSDADKMLKAWIALIGKQELPVGSQSNHVPGITDWYGLDRQPWCAMTGARAAHDAGDVGEFLRGSRWHYCPTVYADAKAKRHGLSIAWDSWGGVGSIHDVRPADIVLFDWDNSGFASSNNHYGCFEKWLNKGAGYFQTIEGNVNSECARHQRYTSSQHCVFVHAV